MFVSVTNVLSVPSSILITCGERAGLLVCDVLLCDVLLCPGSGVVLDCIDS